MTGLALPLSDLPAALLDRPAVRKRVYVRSGQEEVQFHWWHEPAVLPVRVDGSVQLLRWGSKARRDPRLPYGGWVTEDQLKSGVFAAAAPERVVIPAALGCDRGTWYVIAEGVWGVRVEDRSGPLVYILTTPSSNYYRNMTEQNPWMPVLVGQVI